MNVGEKIKELRLERNMKQSDLAELSHISRVAIGNYERGERQPTVEIATKIAKALDVPVFYLTDFSREEQDIREAEIFRSYLKSIGYQVSITADPETIQWHYEDETDDNGNVIGRAKCMDDADPTTSLSKGGKSTAFTAEEFAMLKKEISDSVDYQVWLKGQRNEK